MSGTGVDPRAHSAPKGRGERHWYSPFVDVVKPSKPPCKFCKREPRDDGHRNSNYRSFCANCVRKIMGNPEDWDQEELDKLEPILPAEYLSITEKRLLAKEKELNEKHRREAEMRKAEIEEMHAKQTKLQQQKDALAVYYTNEANKANFENQQKLKEAELTRKVTLQEHKDLMLQRELEHESAQQEKKNELARLMGAAKDNEKEFKRNLQQQEAELKQKELEVDSDVKQSMEDLARKMEEEEKQLNLKLKEDNEKFESTLKEEHEAMKKSSDEAFTSRVIAEVEFTKADGSKLTISDTAPGGPASQIIHDHGLFATDDDDLT